MFDALEVSIWLAMTCAVGCVCYCRFSFRFRIRVVCSFLGVGLPFPCRCSTSLSTSLWFASGKLTLTIWNVFSQIDSEMDYLTNLVYSEIIWLLNVYLLSNWGWKWLKWSIEGLIVLDVYLMPRRRLFDEWITCDDLQN